MKVNVEIKGLEEALRKFEGVRKTVNSSLGKAVKEGADIIRDDAKSRIHNISGTLSKGVISEVTWDKNKSKAFAGAGMDRDMNDKFVVHTKQGIRYYIPSAVEYGHRAPGAAMTLLKTKRGRRKKSKKQIRAHPFMRPAYKSKKGEVARVVENGIRDALRRAGAE